MHALDQTHPPTVKVMHVKVIQKNWYLVIFTVVLTFESVHEILKLDHLSENYWAVLSRGACYCAV